MAGCYSRRMDRVFQVVASAWLICGCAPAADVSQAPTSDACATRYALDVGADGVVEARGYDLYDATHPGAVAYSARDWDADGLPDAVDSWTYDAEGRIARHVHASATASITEMVRNAQGHLIAVLVDDRGDGTIDSIERTAVDAGGQKLEETSDLDADGLVDRRTTYGHDADGRIEWKAVDRDADGTPNRVKTYTYDDVGRRETETSVLVYTGVLLSRSVWTYFSTRGRSGTEQIDENGDGRFDTFRTVRYVDNNLVYEGEPGFEQHYAYRDGLLTHASSLQQLGPGIGLVAVDTRYDYDAEGRLVAMEVVSEALDRGDAPSTTLHSWEHSCP